MNTKTSSSSLFLLCKTSRKLMCNSAPNWAFNADANIGHAFGIFMAYVGTLRTSCSGAG